MLSNDVVLSSLEYELIKPVCCSPLTECLTSADEMASEYHVRSHLLTNLASGYVFRATLFCAPLKLLLVDIKRDNVIIGY